MTINKAIQHFQWKFKNVWKPTKVDIEAINSIIRFVNKKYEEQINDYQLFAKLYITIVDSYISKNEISLLDVSESSLMQKLDMVLKMPIEQHIEKFTANRNSEELSLKLKDDIECPIPKEFSFIHESQLTDFMHKDIDVRTKAKKVFEYRKYKEKKRHHISKMIEEKPELFESYDFTKEEIKDYLTSMVNHAINMSN